MTLISHFVCPGEVLFDLISTQTAILTISGCGAAWLARLLGVQEVPGSNPGSPTKYLKELPTADLPDPTGFYGSTRHAHSGHILLYRALRALRQKRGRSDPRLFYEHNALTRIR